MGLWEFLQQWPRARTVAGFAASVLIHLLVIAGVLWGLAPDLAPQWKTKPGDALIVELPRPDEPVAAGSPAAPPSRAPARESAPPAAPRREAPAPPREERRMARAPEPAPPAPTVPPPTPKAAEPAPKAAEPTPPVPEPLPRAAEAPTVADPTPPPAPEPAPPAAAEPAPPAPQPAPATAERVPPAPAPAPSEPRPEGRERQIASLPPGGPAVPSASDVRAALGRGRGQGRGGIEGDPIPLDSPDGRYSDYLEQVKRKIKQHWGFPCVKNARTRECEHYTTSLDVQFGILKDGRVQFVDIVRVADHAIYDDYAVNAIKLASPFPPVPPAMMRAMRSGSTGLALSARFSYVVESSLTNLLR